MFVDGCFWHGCPEHGVLPKNNREWWADEAGARTRSETDAKDAELDGTRLAAACTSGSTLPVDEMADAVVETRGGTAPAAR